MSGEIVGCMEFGHVLRDIVPIPDATNIDDVIREHSTRELICTSHIWPHVKANSAARANRLPSERSCGAYVHLCFVV
jgi:hypothetical protein